MPLSQNSTSVRQQQLLGASTFTFIFIYKLAMMAQYIEAPQWNQVDQFILAWQRYLNVYLY